MDSLLYNEECYRIVGSCFEVCKDKGCGFLESVYQECLEIELEHQGVDFLAQQPLELRYRGRLLKQKFVPDFVCFGSIVLEIKAVKALADEHRAQVLNYLKATGKSLGLLVNFGHHPKLEWERLAFSARS